MRRAIEALPSRTSEERKQMRTNARRLLDIGSPNQKIEAEALLLALDTIERNEAAARAVRAETMPRADLVVEAFQRKPMTETDRKVVQALLDNPGLTSQDLSAKMGCKSKSWHLHFGAMCERRMNDLWLAPYAEKRNTSFWCGVLADITQGTNLFTMKPEAAVGFARLGIRASRAE